MSQINFLPESFQRAHRRQQRRPTEFIVIGGTLIALAGLWISTNGPDHALANQAEQIEQSLEEIAQLRSEQDRLYQERSGLQRKLITARETYQPISATQVISRLSALSPEPIRLLHIEVSTQRPDPQAVPAVTDKTKVIGNAKPAEPTEPNLMKIMITGHAPSDDQLVKLIRNLDADPVFTAVALRSSKQDQSKSHFVRMFHLDIQIDLDRRFVETNRGAQDAD